MPTSSSSSSSPFSTVSPDMQTPNCTVCPCPSGVNSSFPVQYSNGSVVLREDDLTTPGGGLFGHSRYFTNRMQADGAPANYLGPNGFNWYVSQLPYVATPDGGTTVAVFFDPNNPYWFTKSGGTYSPLYASLNPLDTTLVDGGTYLTFTQTDAGKGRKTVFNNFAAAFAGSFVSYTDERGVQTTVASITSGVINELQRSYTVSGVTTLESLQYAYFTSGSAAGLLQTVTYRKQVGGGAWTYLKQVSFAYYGASDPNGTTNDLLSATQQIFDGTSWDDVAVDYYRFYVSGATNGFVHGLKSHFGPEACRLMFNAGINLSTATDSAVQQYADHIYQYGPGNRVTVETSAVCPSCPGGGTTLDTFSYLPSSFSNDFNHWSTKTQQILPDSSQKIVYANYAGMPMLEVVIDPTGTKIWGTFYRYDTNGRQIWKAMPSAVALPPSLATLEANADLLQYNSGTGLYTYLNNSTGLIEVTDYYSTTGSGAVAGYVQDRQVQQGQSGTPVMVRSYTYTSNTDSGGNTVYPVASDTVYPVAGSTSIAYTTGYAYTFHTGTNQVSQRTTTLPIVTTAQNGSNAADTTVEQFDVYGNLTQRTDERGIINTYAYDPIMSVLVTQVLNYQSGVTAPGVNVTTNFSYDGFGRLIKTVGDSHTVVLSGTATSVQAVTWTVYNQSIQPMSGTWATDSTWTARGYATSGPTYTLIDPVTLTNMDKDGRVTDRITSHRTSGSGALSPTDTFAQADWQTWSSTQYSNSHQTLSARTYFLIPSSGIGTLGTNYGESDYGYDILERRNRVAVWASATAATITRTVWATPQWVASTWVGTVDTGATDSNPAGTNSVQFVQANSQVSGVGIATVALVNNVTVGNTLIAYGSCYNTTAPGSTTVSDSLGNTWTLVATQTGGGTGAGGAGLWVAHITTGGAVTVSFNSGDTQCALAVGEYSGVVSVSPIDTSASATSATSTTTPASGNMTTAKSARTDNLSNFFVRENRIIPFAVEVISLDPDRFQLLVRDLDAAFIPAGV